MSETIEYKGYRIKIEPDDEPHNPREEDDNLGVMVCWHRRCSMGDATVRDAYGKPVYGKPFFQSPQELANYVQSKEVCLYLRVYLYEHGGQTVSIYPFYDPWDSGQVGFIYVTKKRVRQWFAVKRITKKVKADVLEVLKGEVKTYDQWLTGDVWGYQIFDPQDPDCDDSIESCWGYYGRDECEKEAKSLVDFLAKKEEEQAWLKMQEVDA